MTTSPDFNAVLAEVGDRVYGLCVRLDPDPDDAYGAACEHLWSRLGRFDPNRGTLRAWATALTHRLLVDRHRRRARQPHPPSTPTSTSPEQVASAHQRQARLDAALTQLHPGHRRVVVLHHLEGWTLAEIATAEGVALGTVKSRLHRGRGHLALLLKDTQ